MESRSALVPPKADLAEPVASHAGRGPRICPFLGLIDDPQTAAAYARADHQCGLSGVDCPALSWQTHYCLAPEYVECPHFQQAGEAPDFETPAAADRPAAVAVRQRYGRRSGRALPLSGLVVIAVVIVMCGLGAAYSAHVGPWSVAGTSYPSSRLPSSLGDGAIAGQTLNHPYASAAGVAATPLISPTAAVPQPTATIAEPPEALAEAQAEAQSTPMTAGVPGIVPGPGPQSTAPPPAAPAEPKPRATPTPAKPKPTPAPTPAKPKPLPTYTVQTGDTLTSIAQRFHTTIDAIAGLNKISDPNFILAGHVLKLPPTKAGTSPTHSP